MEPYICTADSCKKRIESAYVRCSACKAASYCTVDCQRNDWSKHRAVCSRKISKETEFKPSAYSVPLHNLTNVIVQQERETAMVEEFFKWRKIWYPTIVKCIISMLSCEQYGLEKLRTHGLAIWVSERAEYNSLDVCQRELQEKSERKKWSRNPDWWVEATAFKIGYIRMVPWDQLTTMLECFPQDEAFLNSFRTLFPPNKLRIVAFLAPSFLSYDHDGVSGAIMSSNLPLPRWTFPADSQIPASVQDLIVRTMPYFQPLVTSYKTSGTTDPEDKIRFTHFNSDAWEFIIKKVVEQGWYSNDGQLWREYIDKIACKECRGRETIPAEVRTGLAYLTKVDSAAKRVHSC